MKNAIIVISLYFYSSVYTQDRIDFDVRFTPYVSYYLSVVDMSTGESNVLIFNSTLQKSSLEPDTVTIPVDIEFLIIADSDALGVNNETFISLTSETPIQLNDPIILSNMDLNINTSTIYDISGNPVNMDLSMEAIDFDRANEMLNAIVQTGKLPTGTYTFRVSAFPENGNAVVHEEVIMISSANYLQLIGPGGVLADTLLNEIYSSYPVLQWESDPCLISSGCEYFLRVAEFIPENHSSIEEAIEAQTRLPLNQTTGWESVGFGVTSFSYPVINAGDLEPGHIYVWQVKKVIPTTAGEEIINSDIFAFKVKDFSQSSSSVEGNPTITALGALIGDQIVNQLFVQGAPLFGFGPNGTIIIDGISVDLSFLQTLGNQGIAETDSAGNDIYRPVSILSTEVE